MTLTIGRLAVDDPLSFEEQVGDPIGNMGSAVVPAQRTPLQQSISVPTFPAVGQADSVAVRARIKRQLRAMLSNTPFKLQGGLYVAWDTDTEQNGWYVPDRGAITDGAEAALATGFFKVDSPWNLVGRLRTHRRAAQFYVKDMRTGTAPRDFFKTVYSTDFSTLPTATILALPCGISDAANTSTGSPFATGTGPFAMPRTSRDGGTEFQVTGITNSDILDLGVVSYEQAEANRNLGDVVVFDRRGNLGPFGAAGTGTNLSTNPNFEVSTANWATSGAFMSAGATLTQDATTFQFGTKSCKVVTTNALSGEGAQNIPSGTFLSATKYTFSVYLKGNAGGEQVTIQIGDTASADKGTSNVTLTTAWVRYAVEWTPSSNRSSVYSNVITQAAQALTWFMDGDLVIQSAIGSNPAYFDGDTNGWGWSGTTGLSTSVPVAAGYDSGASGITDPQTNYGWEEVYGPDYPLSSGDVPVLQNGRCRVRYSAGLGASGSGSLQGAGFRVDVYNGTTWVEQGIFSPGSATLGNSADFTLTSAALLEWSPDRAALLVIGTTGGLRVRMVITLQRGWTGPRVEVYNPTSAATFPNVTWYPVSDTLNDFVAKNDGAAAGVAGVAWSGAGTPSWPANQAILGAATMTGENWFSFMRAATVGFDMTIGVVQAAVKLEHDTVGSNGIGYGSGTRSFAVHATNSLYVQANFAFYATLAKQRQEAESMTLGTGTASTADANASAGNAATTTRTTDANLHVSDAALGFVATTKYRVFIRVKVSTSTGNFYVKTGTTTGATVTTTSTAYVWLDCGEVVFSGTFEIHAWATAAATTSVDCYVAIKVEDRYNGSSNTAPLLDGTRDQAAADLLDQRTRQTVVAR